MVVLISAHHLERYEVLIVIVCLVGREARHFHAVVDNGLCSCFAAIYRRAHNGTQGSINIEAIACFIQFSFPLLPFNYTNVQLTQYPIFYFYIWPSA